MIAESIADDSARPSPLRLPAQADIEDYAGGAFGRRRLGRSQVRWGHADYPVKRDLEVPLASEASRQRDGVDFHVRSCHEPCRLHHADAGAVITQ
jgi:hypothetical protein